MTYSEDEPSVLTYTTEYRYLIKCKEKTVGLDVMDQDILFNADGDIDCPIDVVLHKNGYTFSDLMTWDAKEIQFVELSNKRINIIRKIPLNINL